MAKNGNLKKRAGRNGRLTAKERAFCAAYVKDPSRNATQAAREAGYGAPKNAAWRALQRPAVKAFVAELDAMARKRVKAKVHKVTAEVLPAYPGAHLAVTEVHAVASRAEVLAMATNVIRTHESRRLGDLFKLTSGEAPTLVADAEKMAELPLAAVKGLKHDAAGDLELKLADPLAAGKLLLDDHNRAVQGKGAVDLAAALITVLRGAIEGRAALEGE